MGQKLSGILIFISLFVLGFFAMSVSVENPAWDFLLAGVGLFCLGVFIRRKTHVKQESKRFRTVRKLLGRKRTDQIDEEYDDGYENYEEI